MLLSVCMGGFGGHQQQQQQQQRREQFQRASDPQQTLWVFCNATCTRACQDDLQVFICSCKILLFTLVSFPNEDSPWVKLQTWQICFIYIVQCTLFTLKERFDEIVQVLMNGPHPIMHSSLTKVSGVARGDSYSSWPASALPLLLFVIRNECSSPSRTICRW